MRTVTTALVALTLVACNRPADTADNVNATETEAAQVPMAANTTAAASWPIEPGKYEYTRSDGRVGVNTLAADGTYSNAITGGTVETGTWSIENGLNCLVSNEGGDKRCYTFTKPDAEGKFSGSLPDGITITGRKTA